jgi:hypothetical protein
MPSAFSCSLRLLRDGTLAQLDGQKAGPDAVDPEDKTKTIPADQTLIESAKTFAKGEIAMLPKQFNAALVVMAGDLDRENGRSRFEISVVGEIVHE